MGYNLISACHKCKTKVFHYRRRENEAILDFYKKHGPCANEDIANVITMMDNNGVDQDWMKEKYHGGYKYDSLQPE